MGSLDHAFPDTESGHVEIYDRKSDIQIRAKRLVEKETRNISNLQLAYLHRENIQRPRTNFGVVHKMTVKYWKEKNVWW